MMTFLDVGLGVFTQGDIGQDFRSCNQGSERRGLPVRVPCAQAETLSVTKFHGQRDHPIFSLTRALMGQVRHESAFPALTP
jgi:hypothetical protein